MLRWAKQDAPIIEYPPQGQALAGFRDPYIIQRGGPQRPWRIAIGSGIKDKGGTILQYSSDDLLHGTISMHLCLGPSPRHESPHHAQSWLLRIDSMACQAVCRIEMCLSIEGVDSLTGEFHSTVRPATSRVRLQHDAAICRLDV